MAWWYLVAAGLFEVVWASSLKYTEGFTRFWPSVGTMAVSILLLAEALRSIPVGTGYAVWTGIGAAGTGLMGILWFGESRDMLRLLWLVLIILGIVGLRFSSR